MAANARSNRREMNRASCGIASRLSVVSRMSRLRSKSRASSSCRAVASRSRSRTAAERLLAITLTARNANNAAQFCGSAMVKVPNGGMKK